jgi:aspartate carbamoyltransferase
MEVAAAMGRGLKVYPRIPVLQGRVLANCFLEPSTRTASSFHSAMLKLGGDVIHLGPDNSSVKKGETLEDTIRMMQCYSDVIVLRSPVQGAADVAASVSPGFPIINAGDGGGEHPTQALLDLFTIHQNFGGSLRESLTITLLGDLKYGRTVHSLAQLMAHFPNFKLNLVSPPNLRMPDEYLRLLDAAKCRYDVLDKLEPVLAQTDVLYQTRVQKERFTDEQEYLRSKGLFIVSKKTLEQMKSTSIVMHPLPRVDELTADCDDNPRAKYFEQPKNGVLLRMALLAGVLGGDVGVKQ